jgi:Holliday junction resolvase RusA-like endonuclease
MSSAVMQVFVPGAPVSEGSTKYQGTTKRGKPRLVHDNHDALCAWRNTITAATILAARAAGWSLRLDEPVHVGVTFFLPRPQRPRWDVPATKPDLDKLQRAVGDALCPKEGIGVLREDSRIVRWINPEKVYAGARGPGVEITVVRIGETA